jgi:hypothetical protein
MTLSGRRLHFQLTPLLDLLLIVIFAQYLEVTLQAERQSAESERAVADKQQEFEQRYAELQRELKQQRDRLDAERKKIEASEHAEKAKLEQYSQRLDDVVAQQRQAAALVSELFHVPPELIDEALKPLPADAPPRTEQDVERLRQQFRELAALRGPEVIEHLLSYDELRKRADVWTLRIESNGEIEFSPGKSTQSFRASTPAEFSSRLFDRYKTLPQPKGLVVLLVSYGDARADVRQSVLNGLPEAIRLMREDRLGRTQFEYAVLGYIPESPPR